MKQCIPYIRISILKTNKKNIKPSIKIIHTLTCIKLINILMKAMAKMNNFIKPGYFDFINEHTRIWPQEGNCQDE